MVEWDTPGHTSVISRSHPEHVACPEASPWGDYAAEPPAGQLRIASAETTNFTTSVVAAISGMFNSKYLSLGGDEINAKCYTDDAETQTSLDGSGKDFATALSDFTSATHTTLRGTGKTPVVWQEMVLDYNVTTIEKDTLILVWISSEDAISVVEQGYKIIHAASDYFYLDCGLGGWVGDNVEGNSWCDPFKTWQKSYSFDPVANMTSEQAELVLGGTSHSLKFSQCVLIISQASTSSGPSRLLLPTSTLPSGPAPPPPPRCSGQDRAATLPLPSRVSTTWPTASTRGVSQLSHCSLSGVRSALTPAISLHKRTVNLGISVDTFVNECYTLHCIRDPNGLYICHIYWAPVVINLMLANLNLVICMPVTRGKHLYRQACFVRSSARQ